MTSQANSRKTASNIKKKILIVDDDEAILEAVSLVLESEGYVTETTFKGEETFSKIIKFQPNVILLDVLMSGKDGREICKSLKADQELKKIPVIMISAHPTADKGAEEAGADGFISKPFDTQDLLKAIESQLSNV
jgi:CheY-like chemotaxis protein